MGGVWPLATGDVVVNGKGVGEDGEEGERVEVGLARLSSSTTA